MQIWNRWQGYVRLLGQTIVKYRIMPELRVLLLSRPSNVPVSSKTRTWPPGKLPGISHFCKILVKFLGMLAV